MEFLEIIEKKKQGKAHSQEELAFWVDGVTRGTIPDYQLSAWLMAVRLRGMEDGETAWLTRSMQHSGKTLDLSAIDGICVDKHSTGGVADTTTLILVPLVAACGGKVVKMSGRGLGFTGGTIDKLESIPGFQTQRSMAQVISQVQQIGCTVASQSTELAPADQKIYAMRDVTATTDSLPLIASSIMSKKLAAGAQALVLDVKTGSGALLKTTEECIELARVMVEIATTQGIRCTAWVTDMGQPLGCNIGNALEVREAIDVLAGRTEGDLLTLSLLLGAEMLVLSDVASTREEADLRLREALRSGKGLRKLEEMILAQGGEGEIVFDPDKLPSAAWQIPVVAGQSGTLAAVESDTIGAILQSLGAGRMRKEDVIDPAVGLVMSKRVGDSIEAGETLATLHVNDHDRGNAALPEIQVSFHVDKKQQKKSPLCYAVVRQDGIERFA